jgi:hypothetical protein
MRPRGAAVIVVCLALALSSCGGNGGAAPSTSASTNAANSETTLRLAVRHALQKNYELSLFVLGHNRIPKWAQESTRGPALVGLRSSAAVRAKQGIEIHILNHKFKIVSLRLDPSYVSASATVQTMQHVRPYKGNKPLGQAISLNESAQIELHRLGRSNRFLIWKVVLVK